MILAPVEFSHALPSVWSKCEWVDATAHLALQYHYLMAKCGVLRFKWALWLEERGKQVQDEEYQRDHRGRR
jgi:hypothetical protein